MNAEATPVHETLTVPHDLIRRGSNYVLRVKGDRMLAEHIRDGDYLIINACADAESGALVVVDVAGHEGRSVCRLRREGESAWLVVGEYVRWVPAADVRVCGYVVGIIRKY